MLNRLAASAVIGGAIGIAFTYLMIGIAYFLMPCGEDAEYYVFECDTRDPTQQEWIVYGIVACGAISLLGVIPFVVAGFKPLWLTALVTLTTVVACFLLEFGSVGFDVNTPLDVRVQLAVVVLWLLLPPALGPLRAIVDGGYAWR